MRKTVEKGVIQIMTKLGYVVYGALRTEAEQNNIVRPLLVTTN